jgi:hypothetical protein
LPRGCQTKRWIAAGRAIVAQVLDMVVLILRAVVAGTGGGVVPVVMVAWVVLKWLCSDGRR